MLPYVALFVLLCTVARAIDSDEKLHEKYQIECYNKLPEAKKDATMQMYFHQPYFCLFCCFGKNKDNDTVAGCYPKDDSTECTTLSGIEGNFECLSQECVNSDYVKACKGNAAVGTLKSLKANECSLTCRGDTNQTIVRKEGDFCTPKNRDYQKGTCTATGMCKEEYTFVSDPSGGTTADVSYVEEICNDRHKDSNQTATFKLDQEACSSACYFYKGDGVAVEILTLPDEYSCGNNGGECRGGRCTSQGEINQCDQVQSEELKRVDIDECVMKCKGTETEEKTLLPPRSTCTKVVEPYYTPRTGKCDAKGTCVTRR